MAGADAADDGMVNQLKAITAKNTKKQK